MANYYVRSLVSGGTGDGSSWANAYSNLTAALAGKLAGDNFYISEDHVDNSVASVTFTFPGTLVAPNQVLCVNHAGSVPPVSADLRTTAQVNTTGAGFSITLAGFAYFNGIIFQSNVTALGSGGNVSLANTASSQQKFDNCVFRMLSTSAGGNLVTGVGSVLYLNNCSMKFGNVADVISLGRGRFEWANSPNAIDATGALPTFLFQTISAPSHITLEAVDFSAMSGAKTLFNTMGGPVNITMKDCKLVAGLTISAAQTLGIGAGDVRVIRCDPTNNYRFERHNYAGDLITEIINVRTGGASDGVTPIAYNVTTTNSSRLYPFTCLPITIWNDIVGTPMTATVYGVLSGAVALPFKEDIWTDVEFLGNSGTPQGMTVTSGLADILAPLATSSHASDASAWGGPTTTKFKMVTPSFTPQVKGPVTVYVRCAKPATTFYIDPKVVLA